jgi:RNA polymerase sigma-70 factor, ECF subfamily
MLPGQAVFRFDEKLLVAMRHRDGSRPAEAGQHDNLSALSGPRMPAPSTGHGGLTSLDTAQEMNRFLAYVERRAFRIAQMALRSVEDAQDAVQEAMFQLAKRYSARPSAEWTPLFYKILQSRIRDTQRRRMVRNRVLFFVGGQKDDDDDALPDPIASAPDTAGRDPSEQVAQADAMGALEKALNELPGRQREAFMLRILEGLDVEQTARAMGCSEGSVKTHLSRAMHSLRQSLGEHWR